jgi:DNA-binding NtrC family response regulator
MQSVRPKVLIVDDDPSHLDIYGLLVRQAGYEAVPALVRFSGADYPPERDIHLVLLDYKLDCVKSTVEIAEEVRSQYPGAPILLLSDVWSLPPEMAPYVAEFVRKGEPAKLTSTLKRMLPPEKVAS